MINFSKKNRYFLFTVVINLFLTLLFVSAPQTAVASGLVTVDSLFGSNLFSQPKFLKAKNAFLLDYKIASSSVILHWKIVDGYYLYKKRFHFSIIKGKGILGNPVFSKPGVIKDDPYFGRVTIFHNNVTVILPFSPKNQQSFNLKAKWQGCAEVGLCYAPQQKIITLNSSSDLLPKNTTTLKADATPYAKSNNQQFTENLYQSNKQSNIQLTPKINKAPSISKPIPTTRLTPKTENLQTSSGILSFIKNSSPWIVLSIFFLLGIGLAFTPCVFPMIPIISSIISGQKNSSTLKSAYLALAYVLGMALTYAAAGVITGILGATANIQAALQSPITLILSAIIFILFSLSMFGFYELQLPAFIRDNLNTTSQKLHGGHLLGVALIGSLSALIVSPCVSVPLIGTLLYISSTANATMGGLILFALGLGMGIPLILIAVGGGKFLPKAGEWMNKVNAAFGVMLIAVAIWLLERILPASVTLFLWAVFVGILATEMGAFDSARYGLARFSKGLGIMLFLYALALFTGALTGASDPLHPLEKLTSRTIFSDSSTTQISSTTLQGSTL